MSSVQITRIWANKFSKMKKATTHRSAKTGQYVTKKYADSHKSTTVKETTKVTTKK